MCNYAVSAQYPSSSTMHVKTEETNNDGIRTMQYIII